MARYCGKIGYSITEETVPGVWVDKIVEHIHYGDVLTNSSRWDNGTGLNDDISIRNELSIMADPFAFSNFQHIKYAEWMGTLWKVTSISVEYPRLRLSLGGEWNGETPSASCYPGEYIGKC